MAPYIIILPSHPVTLGHCARRRSLIALISNGFGQPFFVLFSRTSFGAATLSPQMEVLLPFSAIFSVPGTECLVNIAIG